MCPKDRDRHRTGSRGCAGPLAPESPLAPGHRAVQHLRGTGLCSTAGLTPAPGHRDAQPRCTGPPGPPSAAHPPLHPGLPPPPVPLRPCAEPRPRSVLTPGAPGGAAGLGSERPWGRSRRRRRFHPGPARPRYCWEAAAAAPPSRRGRGGAGMEPPPPPVRGSASGSPGEPELGPPRAAAAAHRESPRERKHRESPRGTGQRRRDRAEHGGIPAGHPAPSGARGALGEPPGAAAPELSRDPRPWPPPPAPRGRGLGFLGFTRGHASPVHPDPTAPRRGAGGLGRTRKSGGDKRRGWG